MRAAETVNRAQGVLQRLRWAVEVEPDRMLAQRVIKIEGSKARGDCVPSPFAYGGPGERVVRHNDIFWEPGGEQRQRDDEAGAVFADGTVHQNWAVAVGVGDRTDSSSQSRTAGEDQVVVDVFETAGNGRLELEEWVVSDGETVVDGVRAFGRRSEIDDEAHIQCAELFAARVSEVVERRRAQQARACCPASVESAVDFELSLRSPRCFPHHAPRSRFRKRGNALTCNTVRSEGERRVAERWTVCDPRAKGSGVGCERLGHDVAHARRVVVARARLECAVQGMQHEQVAESAEERVDVV
jgi:hypothetical protein